MAIKSKRGNLCTFVKWATDWIIAKCVCTRIPHFAFKVCSQNMVFIDKTQIELSQNVFLKCAIVWDIAKPGFSEVRYPKNSSRTKINFPVECLCLANLENRAHQETIFWGVAFCGVKWSRSLQHRKIRFIQESHISRQIFHRKIWLSLIRHRLKHRKMCFIPKPHLLL